MKITELNSLSQRNNADLLVIPFWKGDQGVEYAGKQTCELEEFFKEAVNSQDFTGKEGEHLVVYMKSQPEKRLSLLGLGEKSEMTVEKLRRAYSSLVKTCQKLKVKSLNVVVPQIPNVDVGRGIADGILMLNYAFEKLKNHTLRDSEVVLIDQIALIEGCDEDFGSALKASTICEGVYFTRDLINGNADDVTPENLVEVSKLLSKKFKRIKTKVFDKKALEKEKFGLLLAVNRGSLIDPALIVAEYRGDTEKEDLTVLIGKGVTFDTGGLNLKPTGSMEDMKYDMAGAATVLGVLYAIASLELRINLTVVIPSTENSIGPKSYKPGDVYQAYDGRTVEVGNTDAEGRLILADAIAYAVKNLKASRIIDFATLTGAITIALGNHAIGLMTNNEDLEKALIEAGEDVHERAHPLPMYAEYREQLKSEIADIKNVGGRAGGSITAAKFLEEFVGKVPWAHFDIAGTAYFDKPFACFPKHATGMGVRLMVSFLENLQNSKCNS